MSNHGENSKTGRKGDPRMHRAVAARLANPSLSLFDALKEGGFDYPADDDVSCVDGDNVKLGQRKNQLSRRVRLARKEGEGKISQSRKAIRKLNDNIAGDDSERLKQQAILDEDLTEADEQQPSEVKAKFHPDYNPFMVQPHLRTNLGIKASTAGPMSSAMNSGMTGAPFSNSPMLPFGGTNGASGVAIASLTRTASSIGMTLEQLALVLQNPQLLTQLVQSATDANASAASGATPQHSTNTSSSSSLPAWQLTNLKDLASAIFKNKCQPLYETAMIQAGFPYEETREEAPTYLQFAWDMLQEEGNRLQKLVQDKTQIKIEFKSIHQKSSTSKDAAFSHSEQRHIHRLEGKCGHKAILHQPKDGAAHIDFVVGDKVECYASVQSPNLPVWPSKYRCEDLSCEEGHACSENVAEFSENMPDPKIYNLSDIELDGKEWISDFANDETIVGLFQLGDTS